MAARPPPGAALGVALAVTAQPAASFGGRGAWRNMSLSRVTVGAVYLFAMLRHFLGQTSTQALHVQQRSLSMFHSRSCLVTMIASVGQHLEGPAEDARLDVDLDPAPALLRAVRFFRPPGIRPRSGPAEEVAQHGF